MYNKKFTNGRRELRGKLVLFLICLVFALPVSAQTLTGGVEYTEEAARVTAFDGVPLKDKTFTAMRYYFTGYISNDVKTLGEIKARFWGVFSFTDYAVVYKDQPNITYYYEKKGNNKVSTINAYNIAENNEKFPFREIKYNAQQELMSIIFNVSPEESYMFNAQGDLIGYRKGDKGGGKANNSSAKIKYKLIYSAP